MVFLSLILVSILNFKILIMISLLNSTHKVEEFLFRSSKGVYNHVIRLSVMGLPPTLELNIVLNVMIRGVHIRHERYCKYKTGMQI